VDGGNDGQAFSAAAENHQSARNSPLKRATGRTSSAAGGLNYLSSLLGSFS